MPLTRERSQARLPPWLLFGFVGLLLLAVLASPVVYAWFSPTEIPLGRYALYGPGYQGTDGNPSLVARGWTVGPFLLVEPGAGQAYVY